MKVRCYVAPCATLRYIPIKKNASTSFIATMFDLSGTVEDIHENKPPMKRWKPDGRPTFTVVRDPFTRFASTWWNKVYRPHRPDTQLIDVFGFEKGMSFASFVDRVEQHGVHALDDHLKPQLDFLPADPDLLHSIKTVRLEFLAQDWKKHDLPAKYLPARHLNSSGCERWDDIYDDALGARVGALYDNDLGFWNTL